MFCGRIPNLLMRIDIVVAFSISMLMMLSLVEMYCLLMASNEGILDF